MVRENNLYFTSLGTSRSAVCTFNGDGTGSVSGTVKITQDSVFGPATFKLDLSGVTPGKHGFHVHEKADLGDTCKNAGGHYNPYNVS